MSKFTGRKHYKYKNTHTPRPQYDFWDPENGNKIPKVRYSKNWYHVIDWDWTRQYKKFHRDLDNHGYLPVKNKEHDKEWRKLHKRIKHKLYFNLPITENDWRLGDSIMDCENERRWLLQEEQENVKKIREREKNKMKK